MGNICRKMASQPLILTVLLGMFGCSEESSDVAGTRADPKDSAETVENFFEKGTESSSLESEVFTDMDAGPDKDLELESDVKGEDTDSNTDTKGKDIDSDSDTEREDPPDTGQNLSTDSGDSKKDTSSDTETSSDTFLEECSASIKCDPGHHCVEGTCLPCLDASHCGEDCVACPSNKPVCVGKTPLLRNCGCQEDKECGVGHWCNTSTQPAGVCSSCGSGRANDAHCGSECLDCSSLGMSCGRRGECLCENGKLCSSGKICVNHICVDCDQANYCGADCVDCSSLNANSSFCNGGACTECVEDPQCGDPLKPACLEGVCGCAIDADCDHGYFCNLNEGSSGMCRPCGNGSAHIKHCGSECQNCAFLERNCSEEPGEGCACANNDDCGEGKICDTENGSCLDCVQDHMCGADCRDCTAGPKPYCDGEICVECLIPEHCTGDNNWCEQESCTTTIFNADFNRSGNGFETYGGNDIWQWNDEKSGYGYFATNLYGYYLVCDKGSILLSPAIDLEPYSGKTVIVKFDTWYSYYDDGFTVEVYYDGKWQSVPPEPSGWPSNSLDAGGALMYCPLSPLQLDSQVSGKPGYVGQSDGWITQTITFKPNSYGSDFKIRFIHGADLAVDDRGAKIDNVRVLVEDTAI